MPNSSFTEFERFRAWTVASKVGREAAFAILARKARSVQLARHTDALVEIIFHLLLFSFRNVAEVFFALYP